MEMEKISPALHLIFMQILICLTFILGLASFQHDIPVLIDPLALAPGIVSFGSLSFLYVTRHCVNNVSRTFYYAFVITGAPIWYGLFVLSRKYLESPDEYLVFTGILVFVTAILLIVVYEYKEKIAEKWNPTMVCSASVTLYCILVPCWQRSNKIKHHIDKTGTKCLNIGGCRAYQRNLPDISASTILFTTRFTETVQRSGIVINDIENKIYIPQASESRLAIHKYETWSFDGFVVELTARKYFPISSREIYYLRGENVFIENLEDSTGDFLISLDGNNMTFGIDHKCKTIHQTKEQVEIKMKSKPKLQCQNNTRH